MNARLRVLALVTNVPGPLAAAALAREGAQVLKIEPPAGDPLAAAAPQWYEAITQRMQVLRLDLRQAAAQARIAEHLAQTDVLLTAMRGGALARLGLDWPALHEKHPRLCRVAIFGDAPPNEDRAGHDLTYQARAGLLAAPAMPRSVFADLFAAERTVAAAYRALFERERTGAGSNAEIAIADGAARLADPLRYGLTSASGPLSGILPVYRLYESSDGWIALAALEPHFQARLREALGIAALDAHALAARFKEQSCSYWEAFAERHDVPLCALAAM